MSLSIRPPARAAERRPAARIAGALTRAVVRKTAQDIQATAQELAPVDTGYLRASITVDETSTSTSYTARVVAGAEYARFIELGTSRPPPRPFLGPAFDRHAPRLEAAVARIAAQGL